MKLSTFVQQEPATTLAAIQRMHDDVKPTDFLGAYAYATQSGVAAFDLAMGEEFWKNTPSRWLFGIDYGRTQPQALREMCDRAEVRIYDGAWLVEQTGFLPRRDFHSKLALFHNPDANRHGMVVGSGNFSSNGLRRSVEAGALVRTDTPEEYAEMLDSSFAAVEALWERATPARDILEAYKARWSRSFQRGELATPGAAIEAKDLFWIEAGYVTPNRQERSPGNQIDFPRNMGMYFGLASSTGMAPNTVIGAIHFETAVGESVTNNLRLNSNMMERVSLPHPETHGFDLYDGKVLVFQRSGGSFILHALEADDFETAFGDRLTDVRVMRGGRRYGSIS